MKLNDKELLVCNCEGTMTIDGKALAKACQAAAKPEKRDAAAAIDVASHLCRAQLTEFQRIAGKADGALLVACTQEAPLFLETLGEIGDKAPPARFVNIRERAGWSKAATAKSPATAKMAALLAEAALDIPDAKSVSMKSNGVLLVLGKDERAVEAAKKVATRLDVTVVLEPGSKVPPPSLMDVPVFTGRITKAQGHLGRFEVTVESFAPASPSSRKSLAFIDGAQSGTSECDLILDLRGGKAPFPAPEKRDGYFNPDPANPALVMDALLALTDMVGEFDKPRYIDYDAKICAHSRSGIVGCQRCIDVCPTGAISPLTREDRVVYDAYVCAGCGACASVCPTGAAKYAMPAGDAVYQRLRTLIHTYLGAGGRNPALLVYDTGYGEEMLGTMARSGGGLPLNVLPFTVNQVTQVGLDFLLAAAAFGAERTLLLLPPGKADERPALESELSLAEAIFDGLGYGAGRVEIVDQTDPEALEAMLYGLAPKPGMPRADFLPMGRKRSVMSLALTQLHKTAPNKLDAIDLPKGAPFGAVVVDVAGCTLCLSCVGACPTGALKDNPEKPQLSFAENACVQCGLCKNTCPESVISLMPRLSFLETARSHQMVKEEQPFECVRCGKPFGTKSSIETMVKKLEGHSMFQDKGGTERLKMCANCRVIVMSTEVKHPLASGIVPKPRTTEDYLREREELREAAAKDMAAKGLTPKPGNGGGKSG
ncbi:MAG TPA: 4Fe-4S dicluster domain-containing protein [Rhodospirillales bacterium]